MSDIGHNENLSLFYTPPSEGSVEYVHWVKVRPISQITPGGTIDFNISGNSLLYMDLSKIKLHIKARVIKADGKDFKDGEYATPINMPLHTIWSQVELTVQQKPICSGVSTRYPYKAMMDILLEHSAIEKESLDSCKMFYADTAGAMEIVNPIGDPVNQGIFYRNERVKNGQTFHMVGGLNIDLFRQRRLLLNGLQVGLRLFPNNEQFNLMSNIEGCRLEVVDAALNVCYVKVASPVVLGHNEALKRASAKYIYDESIIKTYAIARGQYSLTVDDIFQGLVPKNVKMGLVSSAALNGSFSKNPFNFKHYNVNFCGFYVDGQSMPSDPLEPNFKSGNYVESFQSVFNVNPQAGLKYEDYKEGYALYCFDLNQNDEEHVKHIRKQGHTRLEIRFSEALPETATLILYAKFPQILEIDESRKVYLQ